VRFCSAVSVYALSAGCEDEGHYKERVKSNQGRFKRKVR
jgi:hypothetical protein